LGADREGEDEGREEKEEGFGHDFKRM